MQLLRLSHHTPSNIFEGPPPAKKKTSINFFFALKQEFVQISHTEEAEK